MSIIAELAKARARAVGGHVGRIRAYAESRFSEADQFMGVRGTTEGAIDLGGEVSRGYQNIGNAVDMGLSILRERSPVDTGAYRDSHTVIVDGNPVGWPVTLKPRSEVMILSALPYARRLEQGSSDQAPNGVYEVSAAIVAARTRADVTVEYVSAPGQLSVADTPSSVPAMIFKVSS